MIKTITAPLQALAQSELRAHLNLLPTDSAHADDTQISAMCLAAQAMADRYANVSTFTQILELALDAFPDGPIKLDRGPVQSITSVKYIDLNGTEQTLSNTLYALDSYSTPQWLTEAYDTEWPDTLGTVNAVKVRYMTGPSTLDPAARAAILLIVGHLYAHRESVDLNNLATLPMGAYALLDTLKVYA